MINIRHAFISDARTIAEIHVTSWQTIYRGQMPDTLLNNLSIAERETLWKTLLENNTPVLVLEDNARIIGFISLCPSRDEGVDPKSVAEISAIYLKPDQWNKGFGRLLCKAAIEELKKSGYNEVTLWVMDANHQARRFYEKMGFINTSDRKTEEIDDHIIHELRYRKML